MDEKHAWLPAKGLDVAVEMLRPSVKTFGSGDLGFKGMLLLGEVTDLL